jgi:glyoxylase-like metal-dependent hydrolase (beta-lactamase superfamily II)
VRVTELAPGVHSLGTGNAGHVRAFLLEDGGELTLVDTLFQSDARLVLREIDRLGRRVSDLKRIGISHAHRSHLGGLAALKRASGAKVCSHEWEAGIIGGERAAEPVSIVPRWRLGMLPFQLGLRLNRPKHDPCPIDEALVPGDSFGPLQVLDATGHTPGHLAFYWPERKFLIAGDAVATWPELCPGWYGFTLDWPTHRESLRRLAALDAAVVGVGHGDPLTKDAADVVHHVAEMAASHRT